MSKIQRNLAWREFALSRTYPLRRVLWGDGHVTTPPEIPAYREADNAHLTFFCPECFHWHRHGAGEFTGDGDGHRSAHCHCHALSVWPDGTLHSKSESAFAETGYWLREVGLFTARVAAQFPKDIAGRMGSPRKKQFWPEGSPWPIPAPARVIAACDHILAAFVEAIAEDPDLILDPEGDCTLAIPSRDLYRAAQAAGSSERDVTGALSLLDDRNHTVTPEWHEGHFCYAVACSSLRERRADAWPVPLTGTGDHWDPQDALDNEEEYLADHDMDPSGVPAQERTLP